MILGYFDEVKYQPGVQPYEWLGGIFIRSSNLPVVEARLRGLAKDVFRSEHINKGTEFHASAILNGRRIWKCIDLGVRIALLKDLATLLGERELIWRVQARIAVEKLYAEVDRRRMAFIFFIEKANDLLKENGDLGLLIGDFEHQRVVSEVTEQFAKYRSVGTPYQFGKDIDALVDTVHFCHSHHSRLLQLADAYCWFSQLPYGPSAAKEPQKSLIEFARTEADILWPSKFKHWPGEP